MGEAIVYGLKVAIGVVAITATAIFVTTIVSFLGAFVFDSVVGELFALIQMWIPFDLGTIWGFMTLGIGVITGFMTWKLATLVFNYTAKV